MSNDRNMINPFPGLRPFTQEEDYLFFGREDQTIKLLECLRNHRFVAVVGTSGSGKSSLVRCGLLSELLGGKMLQAGAAWEIAVTHPGGNPMGLLTEALLEAELYDREEVHVRENLLATLSRSHFGLVEAVKQAGTADGTNFLLVVDQFEEIFRFHEAGHAQRELANEFVSILLQAVAQSEVPIYVVLTMRSDFIGECGQFEGLAEMINQGEFLIPRLSRDQYKRVIEGPIKVAGGRIAPRLLQRLLNDLGQQADQLPCLQHALMRTWNVWSERGDTDALDLEDYQAVGKMAHALSLHADEIYESLASDRQRALCRGVFQALTVQELDNRGIRRPQRLDRLCQILDVPAEELLPIIDVYRQSGVTFLMPPAEVELTDQTIIDISHESLMRVWTRLRRWVDEESQAAGIYLRLSESAALYERGETGLYRDPELGIALAWLETQQPNAAWAERYHPNFASAIRFLEASRAASVAEEEAREAARQRELEHAQQLAEARQLQLEQEQRSAGKLRRMIAGLAAAAVVAALACGVALVAQNRANLLAEVAQQSAIDADQGRDAARRAEQAMEKTATQAEADRDLAQRESYRSTIRLAESMLAGDEQARYRVADLLWETQPDLRGWEWGHLMARCPLEQWSLSAHDSGLATLAVSPDGRFLATAGSDGTVILWDVATRREQWRVHTGAVHQLSIDPENRFVGVGSADESRPHFKILDLDRGDVVHEASQAGKANVAFSVHGKDFYVLSPGTSVVDEPPPLSLSWLDRYDTNQWQQLARRPIEVPEWNSPVPVWRLQKLFVDSDGTYVGVHIVHAEDSLRFTYFDPQLLHPVYGLDALNAHTHNVSASATPVFHSGMGQILYTLRQSVRRMSHSFDRDFGSPVETVLATLTGKESYLQYDPRSETIIAASDDGTVVVIDSSGETRTLSHGASIRGLALLSDGTFVTGGADGLIKCWNLDEPTDLAVNQPAATSGATGKYVEFTNHGQMLYRSWEANVQFLGEVNTLGFKMFGRPDNKTNSWHFPVLRPETNEFVVDDDTGLLFYSLADLTAGTEKTRAISVARPYAAAFDGSGQVIVVSSHTGKVSAFDLKTNSWFPEPTAEGVGLLAVNLAGTRAAMHSERGLQVWEIASGRLLNHLSIPLPEDDQHYSAPVFHPDGELVAVIDGSKDSIPTLVLWDTTVGRVHAKIEGAPGADFCQCRFSADGSRIFIACEDSKVRIFDWRIGKELLSLAGTTITKVYRPLAISPDGLTIAYGGDSPSLRVARALPWNGKRRPDATFHRALDDLRIHTAHTAGSNEIITSVFTNRGERPIDVNVVVDSKNHKIHRLEAGESFRIPSVRYGIDFSFADSETEEHLESISTTAVPTRDDEGPVGIHLSLTEKPESEADYSESVGDAYRRRGEWSEARSSYSTAISIWKEIVVATPGDAHAQNRLAVAYRKWLAVLELTAPGSAAEAIQPVIDFWTELVANAACHPVARRHLLDVQLEFAKRHAQITQGASEKLTTWISLWIAQLRQEPDDLFVQYGLCELLKHVPLDDPSQAAEHFAQALDVASRSAAVKIAELSVEREEVYTELIKLRPDQLQLYITRVRYLTREGREKDAADTYATARGFLNHQLDQSPDQSDVAESIGDLCAAAARWQEALTWYDRVQPKPAAVALLIGKRAEAFDRLERLDEAAIERRGIAQLLAIELRRVTLELNPGNPSVLNDYAWMLANAEHVLVRDPARAIQLASEGCKQAPGSANNWNTLGVAQYRHGQWQEALESLQKSVQLGADSPENWLFLAMSYWQLGDEQQARTWYDKAIAGREQPALDATLQPFYMEAETLLGDAAPNKPTPNKPTPNATTTEPTDDAGSSPDKR